MDLNICYLPIDNFRNIAVQNNISLVRTAWRVLFAIDGETTTGALMRQLKVKQSHLEKIIDDLISNNLILEKQMTLEEFEKSLNSADFSEEITEPSPATPKNIQKVTAASNVAFDLKNVTDFIIKSGGKGRIGQLAAHRVFLKIRPDILKNAGIESLNEINKNLVIKDDDLKAEIIKTTKMILKQDIPQEMFTL